MEYNLRKTIEPSLQRIFTPSTSFTHLLTPFPARDFVNIGLGNTSRQYSFYLPMHTQPDVHTKAKKDSLNNENVQEGGSETSNDELIDESKDITHVLKKSQPLFNEDNPIEYNERKRKLMGDDIHDSFLHPSFVKTSKITFPSTATKSVKKPSNNSAPKTSTLTMPKTKEIKHKFQFT